MLVNEFGAVDIDSSLLVSEAKAISSGVVELSNGCICCTINESLYAAVEQMLERRSELDHLVIETTGVADPQPVLDTLRLVRFAAVVRVDAIVTVVDAARVVAGWQTSGEQQLGADAACERLQLAAADLLVINKADLIGAAQMKRVRAQLSAAAPRARLVQSQHGKVAPELLLSVHADRHPSTRTVQEETAPSTAAGRAGNADASGEYRLNYGRGDSRVPYWAHSRAAHARPPSAHLDADGFVSVAFRSERKLRLLQFERARRSRGWAAVVRMKGFVAFRECDGSRLTLQQCGPRLDVRVAECEPGQEGGCTLVLIGVHLERQALLAELEACLDDEPIACGVCEDEGRSPAQSLQAQPSHVTSTPAQPSPIKSNQDEGHSPTQLPSSSPPPSSAAAPAGTAMPLPQPPQPPQPPQAPLPPDAPAASVDDGIVRQSAAQPTSSQRGALSDEYVRRVRRDQRFEIGGVESGEALDGGALVRLRLLSWFDVDGDLLSTQLMEAANLSGAGVSWLAPSRRPAGGQGHRL